MADIKFRAKRLLYFALYAIGLGASLGTQVQTASAEIPPEVACERALKLNTIEALEDYLRRYPDASTACNALALDALNRFGQPGANDGNNRGTGGTDGGYGG